ncbi:immunoglobulin superfamily member 1-like [Emys orbicularis]|uniref:immunoglobulin superfamily member 1-like n=1 Tax=Emys orbicularis TaxID=82168 RepID=UPI0031FCC727
MASALTILLLGCWLAGQSRVSGEGSDPKPSISVSPGGVIPMGGNVTIRCWHQLLDMRILLYKDEDENYPNYTDPAGSEAEFPITSARREHGGSYTCRYSNRTGEVAYLEPSDPVQIIVAELSYPKPYISLRPSEGVTLGGAVTIRCRGRHQNMRFLLYKDGNPNMLQDTEPAGDMAEFPIHNVSRGDAGSCYYCSKLDPFIWSHPSDPVELVIAELPVPGPSISVSPSRVIAPGGAVTIRCQCRCEARRLLLYKGGIRIWDLDADGDGGEFTIPSARWEDSGSYSCQSHSGSDPPNWSDPSDYVRIVVAELSYPKPSIYLRPSEGVTLGGAVTIRCRGRHQNMRFLLYKVGNQNLLQDAEPAGDMAEFPIRNVSWRHGGNYRCSYRSKSDRPVQSEPSDPVELVVAELSYPKPSISLSPSEGVSLGGAVTVRCRGQHQGVQFVLNKERRHFPPADSDRSEAVFSSSNVHRDLGGSYSCSYHSRSEPFAVSYPSDPVELVVRDPSLPRPSISLRPTGVTPLGADVTIRCQGQRRDVRFFLHKTGDLNPQRHMDPAEDGAEFRIPTVGRQHGGNYSCSYRHRSEPFVSSQPSDTMELVVAGVSELPAPPGLTSPTIAGVSAAAAVLLLLLLLVAFVCFRKIRARKGAAPRPSSPLGVLKAPAQQDLVYSSVDEGKETQTLEPDPGTDGLTYAELDHQPAQPSVYATINMSQGPRKLEYITSSKSRFSHLCRHELKCSIQEGAKDRPLAFSSDKIASDIRFPLAIVDHRYVLMSLSFEKLRSPHTTVARRVLQLYITCVLENLEWGACPVWQNMTDVVRFDREVFVIDVHTIPMCQRLVKGAVFALTMVDLAWRLQRNHLMGKKGAERITGFLGLQPLAQFFILLALGPQAWLLAGRVERGVGRSQLTQTLHLSEPHFGHYPEFRIPTVGRQHGGSYSCSYRPQSEPFVSSQPSHPVQVVIAAGPPGCPDFSNANIDRLVLCAVVLFVLGLILAEAYYNRPRGVPSLDPAMQRRESPQGTSCCPFGG